MTDIIKANFDEVVFVDDGSERLEFKSLVEHCSELGYSLISNSSNIGPLLSRLNGVEFLRDRNVDYFMFIDCDDLLAQELQRPVDKNFDIITYGLRIRSVNNKIRSKTFIEGEYLALKNHPSMLGRWFKNSTVFPRLKFFADEFGELRFAEDLCFMLFLSFFDLQNKTLSRIGVENIKRPGSLSFKTSYNAELTNSAILKVVMFALNEYKETLNLRYLFQLYSIRHSLLSMHKKEYLVIVFSILKRGDVRNTVKLLHIAFTRLMVKTNV